MDSDIRITPEELAIAKRSLEIWKKTKKEEELSLNQLNLGGTKLKKRKIKVVNL